MTIPRNLPFHAFSLDMRTDHVRNELRTDWSMTLLYRWPGVALAWLLARVGIGPTGVTCISLVLALSLPMQAMLLPMAAAAWTIAISGALFQTLDCADGALARATGRTTVRVADLDYFVFMAQWPLLYAAIGLLADQTFVTGSAWTALAIAAGAARLLARIFRDRVTSRQPVADTGLQRRSLLYLPVAFIAGLSGLIPLLALSGRWLDTAVWFLLVYAVLDIGEALWPMLSGKYGRGGD